MSFGYFSRVGLQFVIVVFPDHARLFFTLLTHMYITVINSLFQIYCPISIYNQDKSQIIAFIFMVPRRRKTNKNRDHTTSKVHMLNIS